MEPALVTTHISNVILLGDRAYKVRRPVAFPFLDLSTVENRRADCEREIRLNSRLAPDVYLGVGNFIGPGIDEPVVVMKRLPADRSLARIVIDGTGDGASAVKQVARRLASFHAAANRSASISRFGSADAMREKWRSNLDEIEPFLGSILEAERHRGLGILANAYLEGRADLFDERVQSGSIRDGHGDIKADDIFCLEDGPRILDCLEFDDSLRYVDVAEDTASLVMDLERLGRPDLGLVLQSSYEEYAGDSPTKSLLHHYIAYRALVRAKVACISAARGDEDAGDRARLLFAMAHTHLVRGAIRLVLVGGLPGTGKSTLSRELCDVQGWTLLSSDAVRREIFEPSGMVTDHLYGAGLYDRRSKDIVYSEILRRAGYLLARGESVVLDASWSDEGHRGDARELARQSSSYLIELECRTTPELADERMRQRRTDVRSLSDATPEIARRMAVDFAPWPQSDIVDTSRDVSAAVEVLFEGPLSREPSLRQVVSGSRY